MLHFDTVHGTQVSFVRLSVSRQLAAGRHCDNQEQAAQPLQQCCLLVLKASGNQELFWMIFSVLRTAAAAAAAASCQSCKRHYSLVKSNLHRST
jgi:hypothetical protein